MPRVAAVRHVQPDAEAQQQGAVVAAFVAEHPRFRLIADNGATLEMNSMLAGVLAVAARVFEQGHGLELVDSDADELTPAEAAQLLGISRPTLLKLIDDGVLPAVNVPGSSHRRLPREGLEDFQRRREAAQEALTGAADGARQSGLFERPVVRRRRRS